MPNRIKNLCIAVIDRIFLGPRTRQETADDGTELFFSRDVGSGSYLLTSPADAPILRPNGTKQYWEKGKLLRAEKPNGTVLHCDPDRQLFFLRGHNNSHDLNREESCWKTRTNPNGSVSERINLFSLRTTYPDGWVEHTDLSGKLRTNTTITVGGSVSMTAAANRYNLHTGRKEWWGYNGQLTAVEENGTRTEYEDEGVNVIEADGTRTRHKNDQIERAIAADGTRTYYTDGKIQSVYHPDGNTDFYKDGELSYRRLGTADPDIDLRTSPDLSLFASRLNVDARYADYRNGEWILRPTWQEREAVRKPASDAFDEAVQKIITAVRYGFIEPALLTSPEELLKGKIYTAADLPQTGKPADSAQQVFDNMAELRERVEDLLDRTKTTLSAVIYAPETTLASQDPIFAQLAAQIRPLASRAQNQLHKPL